MKGPPKGHRKNRTGDSGIVDLRNHVAMCADTSLWYIRNIQARAIGLHGHDIWVINHILANKG